MGFLDCKGWIAQEFYNEYLDLKQDITTLNHYIFYRDSTPEMEAELNDKIKMLKFVLNQLESNGVKMTDLILLSMNIDIDQFKGGN